MADDAWVSEADRTLYEAARRGAVKEVQDLLGKGADPTAYRDYCGRDAVAMAAAKGAVAALQACVARLGEAKAVAAVTAQTEDGEDCVAHAAAQGHVEAVMYLLDLIPSGAITPAYLTLPLSLAAYNGHLEVAQVLVARGADPLAPDRDGTTAVDGALEYGTRHPKQKRLPRHDATHRFLAEAAARRKGAGPAKL